jgi:hypothetical protein
LQEAFAEIDPLGRTVTQTDVIRYTVEKPHKRVVRKSDTTQSE